MFATNTMYDPSLRERVVASHEKVEDLNLQADDLQLWLDSLNGRLKDREALARIEHEKQLKQNQIAFQSGLQYFDYAVNSLTNILTKIAHLKGDKMAGEFKGLPSKPEDFPLKVADLKLQNNPGWEFEVTWSGDSALRVMSGGACLCVNCNGSANLAIPGLPIDEFQVATNNYKQSIEDRLKLIIAYCEKTSKSNP